ncbi:MAG TPA: hypothetical protein VFL03_07505 [Candidatus Limnocylindrales bacterium]|nr:hypothetical protein [Candidatus Limnocylindrales bacterium]
MLLAGALGGPLNRVTWIAAIVGTVLLLLTLTLAGEALPLVLVPLVPAVTSAIGVAVGVLLIPRASRRAFESFAWLGRREMVRFRERTGSSVPTDPAAIQQWLIDNPRSSATAWARLELLAVLGRTDEAAAEQAMMPPPTSDEEIVEHALARRFTTFIATGVVDDRELDEVAPRLRPGSDIELELEVSRAIGHARAMIAAGRDDWREPLLAVRPRLGWAPVRTVTRDLWVKIWAMVFFVGLAIAAIERYL